MDGAARRGSGIGLAGAAGSAVPGLLAVDHQVARSLSAGIAAEQRLGFARAFACAAMVSCAQEEGVELRPVGPGIVLAPMDAFARAAAERLGQGIAGRPDEAAHLIGAAYTAALPDAYRAENGIYYTPPALVERLLDMAEAAGTAWRTARVLDPAAGGGAFLAAAAGRMAAALDHVDPTLALRQLGLRLRGFELDPFAAWLAQAALDLRLAALARQAGRPVPEMVEVRDSLDLRTPDLGGFDLVVGNPPYGRVSLPAGRRAVFTRATYGHANLYGLFTDAALRWAARGGILAYVTPTSMLSGLYYKALRALLAHEAPPVAIDLIAERAGVFEDVLQETMLAVYRRGGGEFVGPADAGQVGFLSLGRSGKAARGAAGSFALPGDPEAPWLLPRTPGQTRIARRLRAMPHRLPDYGYRVSTGPLVWNRHRPQLLGARRPGAYPVVWAESVTPDGSFRWRTERRNHAPWFAADLPRDAWLLTDRPCVLLQRTTAKEQPRRLVAAEMPEDFVRRHGAVVVENHLNMVRPVSAAPAVPLVAIAAFLNSAAADAAFRCINGSVAVSAFELEAMPVPPPGTMLQVAALLHAGAPRAEVEAAISAAYSDHAAADGTDAAAAA